MKAIPLLKALQSRLGASKDSVSNDEDYLELWELIDEAIAELEQRIEELKAPKTCDGCILEDEPTGTDLQKALAYNHCFTCSRAHKDHYKQNDK